MKNWPSILWHFFDRESKKSPNEQLELFINAVFWGDMLELKLSSKDVHLTSCRYMCFTSLPFDTLEKHANRYGQFALGFNRDNLSGFCRKYKLDLNPVFYNYLGHHSSDAINCAIRKENFMDTLIGIPEEQTNVQDLITRIYCLTKTISGKDEYDYYEEQEWRLLALNRNEHGEAIVAKRIRLKDMSSSKKDVLFVRIPIDNLRYIVFPDTGTKSRFQEIMKDCASFRAVNQITFNEIQGRLESLRPSSKNRR